MRRSVEMARAARAHLHSGSCCFGPLLDSNGPTRWSGPTWGRSKVMSREMALRVLAHASGLARHRQHIDALRVLAWMSAQPRPEVAAARVADFIRGEKP